MAQEDLAALERIAETIAAALPEDALASTPLLPTRSRGIETRALEVVWGGEARAQMIALTRENPAAVDERLLGLEPALEEAVKDHSVL